jgi:hypothetical protein
MEVNGKSRAAAEEIVKASSSFGRASLFEFFDGKLSRWEVT